jgi:hypothetical protein
MSETRIPLRTFAAPDGRSYQVTVVGTERSDGTFAGALEFRDGEVRRLSQGETSQPNLDALMYWSTGLEDVFLEGALTRAK